MPLPIIGPIISGIGGFISILGLVLQVLRLIPDIARTIREIIALIKLLKKDGQTDEADAATRRMRAELVLAKATKDRRPLENLRDELRERVRRGVGSPPETVGLD